MDLVRMRVCALLVVIAAFAAVAPAGAEDAAPAPCGESFITDPAGDQIVYPNEGLGIGALATKGPDNMDIERAWLAWDTAADGKPRLTANIQVANLTPDIPSQAHNGTIVYFFDFTTMGDVSWVQAKNKNGAYTFEFGEVLRVPKDVPQAGGAALVNSAAASTGRTFPGVHGIVQIDIPLDRAGAVKPGQTVEGALARTEVENAAASDRGPDGSDTKKIVVSECSAPAATPTPDPSATPVAEAPAPGQPQPQPQPQQPGQQPQSRQESPSSLPFTARASIGSARKVAKKRSFALKVSSSRAISDLVVVVKKGTQVIARGRLATLNGNGVVKLKFNAKRAKAGKYALVAMGTVDGRSLSVTRAVKLAK